MQFDIIAAVNNEKVLGENLRQSPVIVSGEAKLIEERGHPSAASAFAAGLSKSASDIVVFTHQDIYLPLSWLSHFTKAVENLDSRHVAWAVLGVFGRDEKRAYLGTVWSNGHNRELSFPFYELTPVITLDEIVIVLNRNSGVTFDKNLPSFHLYGTDIVLSALAQNQKAFAFPAPVVHNSLPVRYLDAHYGRAYHYMAGKWKKNLPLTTCIVEITARGTPLLISRLRSIKNILLNKKKRRSRHPRPDVLAADLGY